MRHRLVLTVVAALFALGGTASAQSPSPSPGASPTPSSSAPTGALVVTLGTTYLPGFKETALELVRTTLQHGASLEAIHQPGTALSRVESGRIRLTTTDGQVVIQFLPETSLPLETGDSHVVLAGQNIASGPEATMTWHNDDAVPAVFLTTRFLDAPWATASEPVDAGPDAPIVHRYVVTGPVLGSTRGRFTVKDRSGKVIGARLPTERELRFWTPVGSGAGPMTRVRPGLTELMVYWQGGVCGPIVTLDVSKDLRTIKLADHSPGCDAAAMGHWLVLQLHRGWFDPATIRVEWVGADG